MEDNNKVYCISDAPTRQGRVGHRTARETHSGSKDYRQESTPHIGVHGIAEINHEHFASLCIIIQVKKEGPGSPRYIKHNLINSQTNQPYADLCESH
jgi:hypothetical protein